MLTLAFASSPAWCQGNGANPDDSPLRKFERGARPAQNPQPTPHPPRSAGPDEHGSGGSTDHGYNDPDENHRDDDFFGDLLGDLLSDILNGLFSHHHSHASSGTGGGITMQQQDPGIDDDVQHEAGDVLMPYVRFDSAYNNVSSSIYGNDNRLEIGYDDISFLADLYYLTDSTYGTSFSVDRYLLQYRLPVKPRGEVDFGVGRTNMYGASFTQLGTLSVAARFIVKDHVMLEFRPSWTHTIQDYEGTVAYTWTGFTLKAGYRSMTSPGGTLQGPFIGFALHY